MNNPQYIIYTDGACLGNPGPGGWGVIILNQKIREKNQISGSEISTTNNRMELIAVIKALDFIPKESDIKIYTDSKYVINGIQNWIIKWKKNNWLGSHKKPVKNKDLWVMLDKLVHQYAIKWEWVKGHSGDKYNEEVDQLAKNEALKIN